MNEPLIKSAELSENGTVDINRELFFVEKNAEEVNENKRKTSAIFDCDYKRTTSAISDCDYKRNTSALKEG